MRRKPVNIWISGEVEEDVAEPYRIAAVTVRNVVNERISTKNYGDSILDWDLIGIVFAIETPGFPEIRRYKKQKKSVEFRLIIDHGRFRSESQQGQNELVLDALIRSVRIAKLMTIPSFDLDALETDILNIGRGYGWR